MKASRVLVATACSLALVAGACASGEESTGGGTTTAPTSSTLVPSPSTTAPVAALPAPSLEGVVVGLEEIATLDQPVAVSARPGTSDLYVAEQPGTIRRLQARESTDRDGNPTGITYREASGSVIDLSREVTAGGEQGLLGLAFSTDGRTLYVDYTDVDGVTKVAEWGMSGDRVDNEARRDLLVIPQPFENHNGGQLQLGPDGYLYVAVGDGGGAGDPQGNGQNPGTLLGTILRIDPEAPGDERGYGLPPGNPFAGGGGSPEVWLYGARNPWRFSFDALTGDLWVGDVGQDAVEEINLLPSDDRGLNAGRGANLGWPAMEGDQPFDADGPPAGAVAPIHVYVSGEGACSVIGGYVYRGSAIPALQGAYLYGDFCSGEIRALFAVDGAVVDDRALGVTVPQLTSFGQTAEGEIVMTSLDGRVLRLVP